MATASLRAPSPLVLPGSLTESLSSFGGDSLGSLFDGLENPLDLNGGIPVESSLNCQRHVLPDATFCGDYGLVEVHFSDLTQRRRALQNANLTNPHEYHRVWKKVDAYFRSHPSLTHHYVTHTYSGNGYQTPVRVQVTLYDADGLPTTTVMTLQSIHWRTGYFELSYYTATAATLRSALDNAKAAVAKMDADNQALLDKELEVERAQEEEKVRAGLGELARQYPAKASKIDVAGKAVHFAGKRFPVGPGRVMNVDSVGAVLGALSQAADATGPTYSVPQRTGGKVWPRRAKRKSSDITSSTAK